jgi:hypothetical protein
MADIPVLAFRKYWTQQLASLKFECHAIMNKYPEEASIAQVHKLFSDIEYLAHWPMWRKGVEWTSIVNSVEENRVTFFKALDGKLLFSALYSLCVVKLNELKASAQEG